MKKLKSFSVKSMASLSREEMALINGEEFLPFKCTVEDQRCAIPATGGINTGTCKWIYTSEDELHLYCIYD